MILSNDSLRGILNECFDTNDKNRPLAERLLNHPFFYHQDLLTQIQIYNQPKQSQPNITESNFDEKDEKLTSGVQLRFENEVN